MPPYYQKGAICPCTLPYAHDKKGVVFVASAGNNNKDIGSEYFGFQPANIRNAIAVSAFDHNDQKAFFSNFGAKVDVAAPGGGGRFDGESVDKDAATILSLLTSQSISNINSSPLVVGKNYLRLRGTSMAAPHVSGVAALVLGLHPEFSPEQVRQAIRRGAEHVFTPGFNIFEGYGRINAAKSLMASSPLEAHITKPIFQTYNGKQSIEIYGSVNGPNFARWRLEYGSGDSPPDWTIIAASNTPVLNNLFKASDDFEDLSDGDYTLRLVAENSQGESFEDRLKITIDKSLPDRYEISGTLSVSPNPCVIAPQERTCATVLSWTTSGAPKKIAIFMEVFRPAKSAEIVKITEDDLQSGTVAVPTISFSNRHAFVLFDCYEDEICNPYSNKESDDRVLSVTEVAVRKAGENILKVDILREEGGKPSDIRSGIVSGPGIDCGPDPLYYNNLDNGNDCKGSYPIGKVVNLIATPEDGNSQFIGWRGACSGGETSCGVKMDVDKTVYAQFGSSNVPKRPRDLQSEQTGTQRKPAVKLTWVDTSDNEEKFEIERNFFRENNRSKLVDVQANQTEYIDKTVIGGKTYEYYLRACNSYGCSDYDRTGIFIRAPEPALYRLEVQKSGDGQGEITGPGINCGNDCFEEFPEDTDVTITAISNPDSIFSGWTGDCSRTGPACVIKKIKSDKNVTAVFQLKGEFPPLRIINPKQGDFVSPGSKIKISVDTTEIVNINEAQIFINGQIYNGRREGGTNLYSFTWKVPYGFLESYAIKSQALDKQKNIIAESDIITVFSGNPPAVSIINPANGSLVIPKSKVNILVELSPNNNGITKVEYYINGEKKHTDSRFPYKYNWRVPKDSGIEYQLQVKAFSGSILSSVSEIIKVHTSFTPFIEGSILKVTKPGVFHDKGIVKSEPVGIDCGDVCEAFFPPETTVKLTATPEPGYTFNGWSSLNDECLGNNSICVFKIASDTWVMARFGVPNDIPIAPSDAKLSRDETFPTPLAVITWTDNSTNEEKFDVERTEDAGNTWTLAHENGANSQVYYDTTVEQGKEYIYRVRACNDHGCSKYSESNSLGF